MINVTKPFLPPSHEYQKLLDGIWDRCWLTNNGPLVQELEKELKEYLVLENLLYVNNGTIALQIAIKALDLKGEIITTPFSYIATTSSILWEGCKPVFVDIDKETFNIDASRIEEAITPGTCAILATHVYGNPCDIELIEQIAKKHQLKVIYDAAHCFGTKYKGKSVFSFGDVSTTSFHATKLFHTIEGGAVFANDRKLLKRMEYMRNFGHDGPENFAEIGINGKNSEFHAAMGLVNLKYLESILESRQKCSSYYDERLIETNLVKPVVQKDTSYNYAYYPVIFPSEEILLKVADKLERAQIYTRRYFYPLLSNFFQKSKINLPVSESISKRVLCLPLYHDLTTPEIDAVTSVICEELATSLKLAER